MFARISGSGGGVSPSVTVLNAGGVLHENPTPQNDAGTVRSLLEALNEPVAIDIVVGENCAQSPAAIAGLLQSGHLVVQWCGWPFFGCIGEPLPTGHSPFSTVMATWLQQPHAAGENLMTTGSFLYNGPWDFNPSDYKFGPNVTALYPYSRAFITTSTQSNTGMPFYSAPTSGAFPNFNYDYNGTHYYGFSGIMARTVNGGLYFWCADQVPAYNVAEFVAQAAFGRNVTSSGHTSPSQNPSPSTSTPSQTTPSNCLYTVQSGDNMSFIASKFHMSLQALEQLNPVETLPSKNYSVIYPGNTIRVCGTPSTHPSTSSPTQPSTSTPYTPPTTSSPTQPSTSTSGFFGLTPTQERDGLLILAGMVGLYLVGKNL